MTQDLMLVIGLVISGFSIPPIFGALSEGRSPRVSAIMVMIGGSLVVIALSQKPGGYTLRDVPEAFVRVVAYYIR
jgi:hypothetical protein